MNKAFLIGNLTRDPELASVGANNTAVCKFSIAVNRRFADASGERQVDFFNIVAWKGLGENCAKFLEKGKKVAVIGAIQNRSYDAQDGAKRYVTDIVADEVQFLSSKGSSEQGANDDANGGMTPVDDDSLPF